VAYGLPVALLAVFARKCWPYVVSAAALLAGGVVLAARAPPLLRHATPRQYSCGGRERYIAGMHTDVGGCTESRIIAALHG
jgi:hypothetical protein